MRQKTDGTAGMVDGHVGAIANCKRQSTLSLFCVPGFCQGDDYDAPARFLLFFFLLFCTFLLLSHGVFDKSYKQPGAAFCVPRLACLRARNVRNFNEF